MELATADHQPAPTRQALAIEGRSGRLKVTGKLRTAIEAMVWQGMKRDDAALHAKLSVHGLYSALRKPHVRQFYTEQLEVLRDSERARNIHALIEVRDQKGNQMARVQAVKALEQLADEAASRPGSHGIPQAAGLTVIVHAGGLPQQQPAIDVTPAAGSIVSDRERLSD